MNTRKGFTLVELLVVIAILAILATVSVVGYTSFIEGADKQAVVTEAEQAKSLINGGLVLNDCVKVKDNGTDAWVYVDATSGEYVIAPAAPANMKVHDATTDWELKGDLGLSADKKDLTYTFNGYTVDFKTLTATKAQ